MWYFITGILLLALLALHSWWQRRCAGLQLQLRQAQDATSALQKQHDLTTGQKKAEQQALFNSMAEGVLVLDRTGRVQLVNKSLERLLGLTSDVRGLTMLEAFRLQELVELVKRLPLTPMVQGYEIELPGMDERWLQVSAAAVLDSEGAQHGSILVFHDLTRLKQLENTRQEFVANVSHELRTPLSLIKGFVETLLEGAKNDPELSTRFLQTIDKHTDRLTYLIEDLLTISKLESGQTVMNLHQVDLREEVERVKEDLLSRAGEKKVTLENRIPANTWAKADADRLQQVLFNLVENAIKYGGNEGHVIVGGKPLSENKVEVWVQDDGPGIPADSVDRVFERFYRVDRARSRETGGTGLGLAIVKHIVQAHGGEVWVKSELGQGATFFFTLPQA